MGGGRKWPQNEESLAAIRAQGEGRPNWRWVGNDFPMVVRKLRTDRREFTDPSSWGLIAAKGVLFPRPISDRVKCAKIEASLSEISSQTDGRPDFRRVGRYFPRIGRKFRTNRWELTAPSFSSIIAANDSLRSDPFPPRYRCG